MRRSGSASHELVERPGAAQLHSGAQPLPPSARARGDQAEAPWPGRTRLGRTLTRVM